jgi:phosphate starvation-inducible PhoH-like protein
MEKLTPKQKIRSIIKKPKEKFLTESQEEYWKILGENQITLCVGPSGTGKSYIALKRAIDLLWEEDNKFEKIILVRPAVESDEKSLGSLPGSLEEKIDPYISPSYYILKKIIGIDSLDKLKENRCIETMTFNLMRGWTIDNALVIVEESQNTTPNQMKLLLTRIGYNSKFFISGDIEQSDKFKDKTKSGLYDAIKRLESLKSIGIFEFKDEDIVRNPIISDILKRYN